MILISLRMTHVSTLFVFCIYFTIALSKSNDSKTLNVLGFLPMSGSGWTGGAMCLPAALMATRHVNEREDLLAGYNLTYTWVDSQVLHLYFT